MGSIKVESLESQVSYRIREMIRQRVLTKGQKVKERELCEQLGISRTPVREALRTLKSEGLIDIIPNKGAFVSEPSIENIKEIFEVMTLLEGEASRLAAQRITDQELEKLEAIHQELKHRHAEKNSEKYLAANNRYHQYIRKLAKNQILYELIQSLQDKIFLYRTQQLNKLGRFDQSIKEHDKLMKAFRKKDAGAAERAMKNHLKNQEEALVSNQGTDSSKEVAGSTVATMASKQA
ncbi:MAG: GntR family transcriptional regulator [Deltaproteobacteria bacterium]|jgi:DNA-binding GntR family transcriptional regulator|nr:GntR family transcriptional regulator [Deltaproteobacteria bacterium]